MASGRLVQRYFHFDQKERKDFFITSIILSLILFFFVWRTTDYDLVSALASYFQFFIIVIGSLFLFVAVPKWFAIHRHYTAQYQGWLMASLIGFVVSFTTYGFVPLLFPGLIEIQRIDRLRHGKVFPGENRYDIFTILSLAPITSIFLSIILQFFFQLTDLPFFYAGMVFSAALAFFSLLPFSKNIGAHLFYTNKTNYFFLLFFSFSFFIFTIAGLFFSAVFATILTGILWLLSKKHLKKQYGV
ncbi:MAG: hypothetical protein KC535_06065 [Nanoarchaeota archaeon]|nr:hypothetical protein [Nanoarchaeota archaeon]